MSATRSTIASIHAASPALTFAIRCRNPNSSARDNRTYRSRRARSRSTRSSSGAASITLAAATCNTVDGAWPPITRATARSTTTTCPLVNARESTATLRATHGSHSPARTRTHTNGSRCTRSNASAINARAVNA